MGYSRLGSLAFISLGFVISSFAKNQEAADALANANSFPMLFLAGVFFPVDSAPDWLQPIMRLIPLRYLADGLRNLMIRDATLPGEWLNVVVRQTWAYTEMMPQVPVLGTGLSPLLQWLLLPSLALWLARGQSMPRRRPTTAAAPSPRRAQQVQ